MTNTHPTTGIRYTVYAMRNLDPDVYHHLWYGPHAINVTEQAFYEGALEEAKLEARREADSNGEVFDEEAFLDDWECPEFDIDESDIEGVYQGVAYQISHLGGAELLWVLESPYRFFGNLCSPCCPGAVNFDSGPGPFEGYGVPESWLAKC